MDAAPIGNDVSGGQCDSGTETPNVNRAGLPGQQGTLPVETGDDTAENCGQAGFWPLSIDYNPTKDPTNKVCRGKLERPNGRRGAQRLAKLLPANPPA